MNMNAGISEDDNFAALMLAITVGVPAAIAYFTRDRIVGWLLEYQVLVPAAGDPLLKIPAAGGAGLDLARLVIALGVLMGLIVAAAGVLARRRRGASPEATR